MKIVSIRPTDSEAPDPAITMLEARITQLGREISELKLKLNRHLELKTGAPVLDSENLAMYDKYLKLGSERSRLQVEKAELIFADWKQKNNQPEPAARRWTIYRNSQK